MYAFSNRKTIKKQKKAVHQYLAQILSQRRYDKYKAILQKKITNPIDVTPNIASFAIYGKEIIKEIINVFTYLGNV